MNILINTKKTMTELIEINDHTIEVQGHSVNLNFTVREIYTPEIPSISPSHLEYDDYNYDIIDITYSFGVMEGEECSIEKFKTEVPNYDEYIISELMDYKF